MKELKKPPFLSLVKHVSLASSKRLLGDLSLCFRGSAGDPLGTCALLMNPDEKWPVSNAKHRKPLHHTRATKAEPYEFCQHVLNVRC